MTAAVAAAAAAYARMLCSPLVVCTRRSPPQQEAVAASARGGDHLWEAVAACGRRLGRRRSPAHRLGSLGYQPGPFKPELDVRLPSTNRRAAFVFCCCLLKDGHAFIALKEIR